MLALSAVLVSLTPHSIAVCWDHR